MSKRVLSALAILLSACTAPAAVEVPPPLVITMVVTPTGAASGTGGQPSPSPQGPGSNAPTSAPGQAAPAASNASYPPPFQNTMTGVYQDFERGFLIYLPDRKAIWAFIRSAGPSATYGQWMAFADTFEEGELETDPSLAAPAGFQQPKRGFGKVWRETPVLRELLGWGLDFERAYTTTVIDYSIGVFDANGKYTPHSFIHTVGALDGSLIHIDEATRLWSKP